VKPSRLVYRAWFYFRQGYATYLAFLIGFVSNIIVIYSLGIKPVIESGGTLGSIAQTLFPHLTNFVVIAAVIISPVCIYLGLLHMKRTGAFSADASVSMESNPYAYKLVPGKEQEAWFPLVVLTAKWLARILDQQNAMTSEEKKEFEEVISKANILLKGQPVGTPEQVGLLRFGRRKERSGASN
jgi:hypothetical protein